MYILIFFIFNTCHKKSKTITKLNIPAQAEGLESCHSASP